MRRLVTAALLLSLAGPAHGQQAEQRNMRLVGHDDLQARSAYQPVIHHQGNRWIAYIGHHGGRRLNPLTGQVELNGTSIVDVSDPRRPRYLHHIPGAAGEAEAGGAAMVRVCDGKTLPRGDPAKTYLLRTLGNVAHEVWDVTEPARPAIVTAVLQGLNATHKNWWECDTGIAYLVSDGRPSGWRTNRMTKIYDLGDPAQPRFVRDFGLPGQQPGASGPAPEGLHGAIAFRNRVYIAYGTGSRGTLQIVDRDKLLNGNPQIADRFAPTVENLVYPQIGRLDMTPDWGGHTAFPVLGVPVADWAENAAGRIRDFVLLISESLRNECQEVRQLSFMVDISDPSKPFPVSTFGVPESSGHFCSRGGRFGPHSSNESFTSIYYGRLVFIAYFNAGVRAVDIRDPFNPREAGFYIPAVTSRTDKRCVMVGGAERCKVAVQTNNVEVDDRGYIYAVDRADTGMHILELSGAARAIANFAGKGD
jgi:LVIVD repeat-containing protein